MVSGTANICHVLTMSDNGATVSCMALGKQEDINEDVTGVIEAQEFSLGIVHATGHVCILLAVGDFKVGTKAAPDTAREIAAALVKLADEVEAESASEATGKAGL